MESSEELVKAINQLAANVADLSNSLDKHNELFAKLFSFDSDGKSYNAIDDLKNTIEDLTEAIYSK